MDKMNRKGSVWAWDELGKWVMLVAVLLIIVTSFGYYIFPRTLNKLGNVLGFNKSYTLEEFVPYVPQLTLEEGEVEDSMNAFVCASASTATHF